MSRPHARNLPRTMSSDDVNGRLRPSFPARVINRVRTRTSMFSGLDRGTEEDVVKTRLYDDTSLQEEAQSSSDNGLRVWYESYTTIDWIHDSIKESSRLRRLRGRKGLSGILANTWDQFQGWLVVTITGILTALIAGWIIQSEAVLFDLKEGYCGRDWRLAKRFCCPFARGPDWDGSGSSTRSNSASYNTSSLFSPSKGLSLLPRMNNRILAGWAGPVAASPKWRAVMEDESCPGWITWGDRFSLSGEENWIADYGMYVGIAILWASIASLLTIYLTSSELYISKKDGIAGSATPARKTSSSTTSPQASPHTTSSEFVDTSGQCDERTPLFSAQDRQSRPTSSYSATSTPPKALPPKFISQMADRNRISDAIPSRKVLYFGSGSGISEVKCILSGFVIHGYLGFWTLFTKSVGLTLSVASGLSLGKEGPFVHIASCVGNIVCRLFSKYERNESKRREMLSCACAAGVAVAFGAPVGGVLFSMEEVSYYFPAKVLFRSFFCAMVAAATLRFIDPFGTGKTVLFQVTYDRDWHWLELIFFIVIGVFGGLYGAFFTRLNVIWSTRVRSKTWMAKHPVYEVVLITVISVVLSFLNGYTRMSGPELIADLFSECHEHESLDGLCVSKPSEIGPLLCAIAFAMIVKGLLTIITFGIKLPAGIFIPTLAVGACFGRIVGLLVQYAQWTHPESSLFDWCREDSTSCIVPGVYAMVGAAAALSGVTRTTVSLVVIMFELTGTLTYAVPVMLSVLVARTIADALEHKGIYDLVMQFSGLPYLDAKEEHTWQGVSIVDAVDTGIEVISLEEENTVDVLRVKLQRLALGLGYTDGGFPLVVNIKDTQQNNSNAKKSWRLVGYIAAQELEHGLNSFASALDRSGDADIDHGQSVCTFDHVSRGDGQTLPMMRDSIMFSLDEPSDLSVYVDKAPCTVTTSTSLELVHQMFVKLGIRYLVVLNDDGSFKGLIFKKRFVCTRIALP
ncbi:hypothetical protein CBS101457_003573 [Exobasidium rhododendri]|nr:hypothetical protein CBS101457_003573 [Exobasidium rhododendri]